MTNTLASNQKLTDPLIQKKETNRLAHSKIFDKLKELSYTIGQERKLLYLRKLIKELERKRDQIHEIIPSTPFEEMQDWEMALTYFANNVIDGWNNFAIQIEENSYIELKNIYLDDLKKLKAYHIWLANDLENTISDTNYYQACQEVHSKLYDFDLKATKGEFEYIKMVVNKDIKNKKEIIKQKAQRIFEIRKKCNIQSNPIEDWVKAEQYVNIFYSNIIQAVNGNYGSLEKVIKNFRELGRENCIINCFETSIAVYFFNTESIITVCENNNWEYNDIL